MRAFFEWALEDTSKPFGERFLLVVSTVLVWWRLDGVRVAIVTDCGGLWSRSQSWTYSRLRPEMCYSIKKRGRRRGEQRRTTVVGDGQRGNWNRGAQQNRCLDFCLPDRAV